MQTESTNDANIDRLAAAHPALFEGRMPAWSHLPQGWYSLVDLLCTGIEHEIEPNLVGRIRVLQVKEKFGTLRFYTSLDGHKDTYLDIVSAEGVETLVVGPKQEDAEPPHIAMARHRLRELVDSACATSSEICSKCGAAGSLRQLAWIQVLCNEHFSLATEDAARLNGDGDIDDHEGEA